MIEHIKGNLLDFPKCNVIAHGCNIHNTFGAGIALQIKEEYPLAYEADCEAAKAGKNQLGTVSQAVLPNGKRILNLYQQTLKSDGTRALDYEAFYSALEQVKIVLEKAHAQGRIYTLGLPYKIGCGLAGGSWKVVYAMIEDLFLDSPIKVVIVEYVKK